MIFDKHNDASFVRQFIAHRLPQTALILVLGMLSNVFTIMIPISIGRYYELVLGYSSNRLKFLSVVPDAWWDQPSSFLIFFGTIVVLRFVLFFTYELKLRNESDLFIKELKDLLFANQIKITTQTYQQKGTGKYLLRYTGDINSLKNLYRKGAIPVTIDVMMLMIGLAILWSINAIGGMVVLSSVVLGYFIVKVINIQLEKASLHKRNKTSQQLAFVSRILSRIISVKVFNRQAIEAKRYASKSTKVLDEATKFNKWFVLNTAFIHLMQYSTLLIVLIVFFNMKEKSSFNPSALISFILLYLTLIPALRRIYKLESVLKLGGISETKLMNILQQQQDSDKGIDLEVNNPRLTLENLVLVLGANPIDFVSKKKDYAELEIKNANIVKKLINALGNLYTDYEGVISINKTNIKDISSPTLRSIVSISSTHYPLVGNTVYEAIVKSRSSRTRPKVEEIFELLKENLLPQSTLSLDSKIGENASNIEPLEIELLALTRGFTNDITTSKIIIIDKFRLLEQNKPNFGQLLLDLDKTVIKLNYD